MRICGAHPLPEELRKDLEFSVPLRIVDGLVFAEQGQAESPTVSLAIAPSGLFLSIPHSHSLLRSCLGKEEHDKTQGASTTCFLLPGPLRPLRTFLSMLSDLTGSPHLFPTSQLHLPFLRMRK